MEKRISGMPEMQAIILDVRGQICPATLLVALENMIMHRTELSNGAAKLHIMTDNRDATATIPATARNMGYTVTVEQESGYYTIEISRPPAAISEVGS